MSKNVNTWLIANAVLRGLRYILCVNVLFWLNGYSEQWGVDLECSK